MLFLINEVIVADKFSPSLGRDQGYSRSPQPKKPRLSIFLIFTATAKSRFRSFSVGFRNIGGSAKAASESQIFMFGSTARILSVSFWAESAIISGKSGIVPSAE